ncbi:MAG: T9SS type A sorting domain-containing protein [Bacteroidales bacterium]|nr:T9SS type A sorting domain-containing protein [Bacteroidales bacterium]
MKYSNLRIPIFNKTTFLTGLFTILIIAGFSQPIPPDSLYLGQNPPGIIPIIFNLPTSVGLRPVERITISSDGKEIYYSEQDTWPPSNMRIKCIKYNGSWQSPVISFEGFIAPALSVNDSTIYMQKNINGLACTYYSTKNASGWSTPARLLSTTQSTHYFQNTQSQNQYLASTPGGNGDICQLVINNPDTSIQSLGLPINTLVTENDFFIARDESYLIVFRNTSPYDMFISYNKGNGNWTNPKSMGININTSIYDCSPFVTGDNKYLFFTRGGNTMPSYYTYWVRVDALIDSLSNTNFSPYVNMVIPNQTGIIGQLFEYTIPDSTFIDDDGNNTLTYSATLTNGSPLPAWLSFDPLSHHFFGTPTSFQTLYVKVVVTDAAGAFISTVLKIIVEDASATNQLKGQGLNVFPNPTKDFFRINYDGGDLSSIVIEDILGNIVYNQPVNSQNPLIDVSGLKSGIYFVKLQTKSRKMIWTKLIKSK